MALVLVASTACGDGAGFPAARATTAAGSVPATVTPTIAASPSATQAATPPPRARGTPSLADGVPVGSVGPLLLYVTTVEDPISFGLTSPSPEVVVWDAGAAVEVARIWIGSTGSMPGEARLAGLTVLVNFGLSLERFALDGSHAGLFEPPAGSFISHIQVDPSGEIVVVSTVQMLGGPSRLWWVDVASGAIRREASPALDAATFGTPHARVVGPSGDTLLLRGDTYSDAPASYASLGRGGAPRGLPVTGPATPSPNGRLVAHGFDDRCGVVSGSRVELLEVESGTPIASFEDGSSALLPWEWSPDGNEFAFQARPLDAATACPNGRATPRWLVLSSDGAVREVSSDDALRAEWYGTRAVSFSCGAVDDSGRIDSADGLLRPDACARSEADVHLNGTLIGIGERISILGFVDID